MRKQNSTSLPGAAALGGIALGALAMYLADPVQGRRRRELVQEKMRTASEATGSVLSEAMHRTENRMSSAQLRAKSLLRRKQLDDESLQDRVRNTVAMLASFPEEVRIKAEQGKVILSGTVAAKEKERLLRKIRRIPGVRELRDQLELKTIARKPWFRDAHASPRHSSALDASSEKASDSIKGAARRLPIGAMLTVAGLGYMIQRLGKSVQKRPRMRGTASRNEEINLQKVIEIQASPETVFNIWSKYDNFPQFLSHLVEVQSLGMQRSHWIMRGPAGVGVEWDAELTKYMEPSLLAWKTEPGAPIEHQGSVRFESYNGGTRATVRMHYKPVAGRTNSLAALLGDDPEQDLENNLLNMKNFIEGSNIPHDLTRISPSSGQVLH